MHCSPIINHHLNFLILFGGDLLTRWRCRLASFRIVIGTAYLTSWCKLSKVILHFWTWRGTSFPQILSTLLILG